MKIPAVRPILWTLPLLLSYGLGLAVGRHLNYKQAELRPERRVVRSYCPPGSYWDAVENACVYCRDICRPEFSVEYCRINCPEYAKEFLANLTNVMMISTTISSPMRTTNGPTTRSAPEGSTDGGFLTQRMAYLLLIAVLTAVIILVIGVLITVIVVCKYRQSSPVKSSSYVQPDGASKPLIGGSPMISDNNNVMSLVSHDGDSVTKTGHIDVPKFLASCQPALSTAVSSADGHLSSTSSSSSSSTSASQILITVTLQQQQRRNVSESSDAGTSLRMGDSCYLMITDGCVDHRTSPSATPS